MSEQNQNPLVGRATELATLHARLAGGARHVVLVGPPGVGKSSLAYALAHSFPRQLVCQLDDARNMGDIATALAALTRLAPPQGTVRDALDAIARMLAEDGPLVLVLDDVDGALGELEAVGSALLEGAPKLRILSTSRERPVLSRAPGSAQAPTDPSSPSFAPTTAMETFEVEPLALEAAVALFFALAPRTDPGDREAVMALAERVDRLPLALELVSIHAETLRPVELLARVDKLLVGASVHAARGLEATLKSSWERLSIVERQALLACAVFRGGVSTSGAEAVIGGSTAVAITSIASLERASLLARRTSRTGETRWAPYDAIRDFVLRESLDGEGDELALARERHRSHFVAASEIWARSMRGRNAHAAREHLLEERANVAQAIEQSLASHPEDAVRAAFALDEVLSVHATHDVELANLELAVRASERCSPAWRARALARRGWAEQRAGQGHAALSDLERALTLAQESGEARVRCEVLCRLGHLHLRWMRLDDAARALAEALEISVEDASLEDVHAEALGRRGVLELERGAPRDAIRSFDRAAELHEAVGNLRSAAAALSSGAVARYALGEFVPAEADLERALEMADALDDRRLRAAVLVNQSLIDHESGALAVARAHQQEALQLARRDAFLRAEAACERRIALLELSCGEDDAARAALERAVKVARRGRFGFDEGYALALLAIATPASAERLLELARIHLGSTLDVLADIVRAVIAADPIAAARACDPVTLTKIGGLGSFPEARLLARVARDRAARPRVLASTLTLAADGGWFEIGAGQRVSLARRGAVRRLLLELAHRRRDKPGVATDVHTLFESAWPGDRARPDFAAARVYESVRVLRKLGLRDLLVHREDGYLLDPDVSIELA